MNTMRITVPAPTAAALPAPCALLAADLVLGLAPRAGRLPRDMAEISRRERVGMCAGTLSAEHALRADHISSLFRR